MVPLLVLLGLAGILGATQDIATDGVYVTTLTPAEQAKYLGVQSMCWNAGPILANGVLVRASGMLHKDSGSWNQAWLVVILVIAGLMAAMGLMIYMMQQVSPGPYRTAHYTFGSALMGLNMMLTGMISGKVQEMLGYAREGYSLVPELSEALTSKRKAPIPTSFGPEFCGRTKATPFAEQVAISKHQRTFNYVENGLPAGVIIVRHLSLKRA
jgi:MFS family permease